jgi:hypothetical protein
MAVGYQYVLGRSGLATPGFVYPGRYELVWMPLTAVPLMVALSRVRALWVGFIPLLILSLGLTYQASQRTGFVLLNTGQVGLPLAQHLESAFPDIEGPNLTTAFIADQKTQYRTVGRVITKKHIAVADPKDGQGYLTAGPRVPLAAGTYEATFGVTQRGGKGRQPVVDLQLWALPGVMLAERPLSPGDLRSGKPAVIKIPFASPGGLLVEARALVYGRARVELGPIEAHFLTIATSPLNDEHPNAALMLTWVFGTIFVGALLVGAMRRQRRPPSALP